MNDPPPVHGFSDSSPVEGLASRSVGFSDILDRGLPIRGHRPVRDDPGEPDRFGLRPRLDRDRARHQHRDLLLRLCNGLVDRAGARRVLAGSEGTAVAAIVLVAAVSGVDLDERAEKLLAQYRDRLVPLVV